MDPQILRNLWHERYHVTEMGGMAERTWSSSLDPSFLPHLLCLVKALPTPSEGKIVMKFLERLTKRL